MRAHRAPSASPYAPCTRLTDEWLSLRSPYPVCRSEVIQGASALRRVGLRTPRRRLGVDDVGDEPADRIVEDGVIVDYWTGVGPASALPQQGNGSRILGLRGIRGLTVV
jgi:hypothetical protein